MTKKNKAMEFTIGAKVYLIHRNWTGKKIGARILLAKVKTFMRSEKGVDPIFTEIGNNKRELTMDSFVVFTDINEAIKYL